MRHLKDGVYNGPPFSLQEIHGDLIITPEIEEMMEEGAARRSTDIMVRLSRTEKPRVGLYLVVALLLVSVVAGVLWLRA